MPTDVGRRAVCCGLFASAPQRGCYIGVDAAAAGAVPSERSRVLARPAPNTSSALTEVLLTRDGGHAAGRPAGIQDRAYDTAGRAQVRTGWRRLGLTPSGRAVDSHRRRLPAVRRPDRHSTDLVQVHLRRRRLRLPRVGDLDREFRRHDRHGASDVSVRRKAHTQDVVERSHRKRLIHTSVVPLPQS